jgi:glycosyltransferase involved in cell wall biosynthesis
LSIKSKLEFCRRAIDFWKIYGFREFIRLSVSYIRGQISAPEDVPLKADASLLQHERVNPRATVASDLFKEPFVAIIGELSLPQCKKYRVLQKMEILALMGVDHEYSFWGDGHRSMGLLQLATVAIFYRVPDCERFRAYIEECGRLGVRTIYDIDDPIFSVSAYSCNHNLEYLHPAEKSGLLDRCKEFLSAMESCERLSGSTPQICDLMARESNKESFLWRNLIDAETIQASRLALTKAKAVSTKIRLGYASGSRAHEADFRVITAVIQNVMEKFDHTELHILGHLVLPSGLASYEDRIVQHEFTDYVGYMDYLAEVDVNLVPLITDEFNECKSAIRYLESGLLGIPSIVTAVGDFKNVVNHGETGFLAENEEEWQAYLERLIQDAELRGLIGGNAQSSVLSEYCILNERYSGQIDSNLVEIINGS